MLTKEQKIEAYSWVIKEINKNLAYSFGMCYFMDTWLFDKLGISSKQYKLLPKYFPEVFKVRLIRKHGGDKKNIRWFAGTPEGHQKRIQLLQEVIKTLEQSC